MDEQIKEYFFVCLYTLLGFAAKRKRCFKKISKFSRNKFIFPFFVFHSKFRFNLFRDKMQNFCKLENAKKLKKFGEKNSKLKKCQIFFLSKCIKKTKYSFNTKMFRKMRNFCRNA